MRRTIIGGSRSALVSASILALTCVCATVLALCAGARPAAAQGDPLQGTWRRWLTPDARFAHKAAFDPVHRRMFVFGGVNIGAGQLDDLWMLQMGATPVWTRVKTTGSPPQSRVYHEIVYDPARDRVLLVGGVDGIGQLLRDIWVLPLSGDSAFVWSGRFAIGPPPPSIARGAAVMDAARDRIVFDMGVVDSHVTREVWTLSVDEPMRWKQLDVSGTAPIARYDHTAVLDAEHDRLLMFGGYDSIGTAHDDVWALALTGPPTWSEVVPIGTRPRPCYEHTAVVDAVAGKMIVFGGYTYPWDYSRDVWSFDLAGTPAWTQLGLSLRWPYPNPLSEHVAAFDDSSRSMIVFGGFTGPAGPVSDQTWSFSPDSDQWTLLQLPVVEPAVVERVTLVADPVGNRALMFGGRTPTGASNEFWSIPLDDPGAWVRLAPAGPVPPARTDHAAAIDLLRHRMLLFGGYRWTEPYLHDLWAFDLQPGGGWTDVTAAGGPDGLFGHSLVVDTNRDRLVVFSGSDGHTYPYLSRVWTLDLASPTQWQELITSGPAPSGRIGHAAVYDADHDRMIVHGGTDSTGARSDTWALDMATCAWSEIATGTPAPIGESHPMMVIDRNRDRLVLLGAWDSSRGEQALWSLDLESPLAWARLHPVGVTPQILMWGTAAFDQAGDRMIIAAGNYTDTAINPYALHFTPPRLGVEPAPRHALATLRAWPNPVVRGSRVTFAAPGAVAVFDLSGRRVADVAMPGGADPRGTWDLRDHSGAPVAPGLYFAITTQGPRAAQRIVVLR